MFNNLTDRLGKILKNITGTGRLTEENIQESLREVRIALLEADVALSVIKQFIDQVREKAIGQEVMKNIRPGEALVKIVHDELVTILGGEQATINLAAQPPAVILVAGLQGSGKTTTTAKLAKYLQETQKKTVLLTSVDIYRPAAITQLETLAKQINAHYFPSTTSQKPENIVKDALTYARTQSLDVVIVDTAGRLHIDQEMMDELKRVHQTANPVETLLVVDSMTGQDAVNTAKVFSESISLTGVILTKTDGDTRGGAALSMRIITGKPIKFIGAGEKVDALEAFYPDRFASRILGMGDIVSLVEEVSRKVDREQAEKAAKKFKKGAFDLEDFKAQLEQMRKMGGLTSLISKLPGAGQLPPGANNMNETMFVEMEVIINSMTRKERKFPHLINGSRKRRIAMGSGRDIQAVNRLLKQFTQMQKMMKKMGGKGMAKMMQKMKGRLPPGLPF